MDTPNHSIFATGGRPSVVIEVELSAKTKDSGGYAEILRAYAEAQAERHISKVVHLVSEDATLSAKRLNVLLDRARVRTVLPMGRTADTDVRTIPAEVWQPLAVRLRNRGEMRSPRLSS